MKRNLLRFQLGWLFLVTAGLILTIPAMVWGAPRPQSLNITCAEEYTVQAGDWLSKLADKYLDDLLAYPVIVEATNQKELEDYNFALYGYPPEGQLWDVELACAQR